MASKRTEQNMLDYAEVGQDVQEPPFDVESLTPQEIKQKLKELGVKTRLRCVNKLKNLLVEEMRDNENHPIE